MNFRKPSSQARTKDEVVLHIPGGCKAYLMDEGEALELANGDFTIIRRSQDNVTIATIVKIGQEIKWPLTKDEPVVKLDDFNYLFSLPAKEGDSLSYGVSFSEQKGKKLHLGSLDAFLKENACFSCLSASTGDKVFVNWKEFAPRVEDYQNSLAKAIAEGTGFIVKGIFTISNAYSNQVNKVGETLFTSGIERKNGISTGESKRNNKNTKATTKREAQDKIKRAKEMSEMTEKISKNVLDGVHSATGSMVIPIVQSQMAQAIFATAPGEVILASLDAINKVLDALEVAEKQAQAATSDAATNIVTKRYGEAAGETTRDALATAGHCTDTAWNIFKIRKAVNPASYTSTGVLKSAAKSRKP